ncbi:MAG: hypothetical protein NTY09_00785 [bacterium]|nr:hypothetical protein [bacterium]
MKIFLNILLAFFIVAMLFAIIMEGVVIRNVSDNHLWARQGIRDIGQFLVDPCQPGIAYDAFIKYDNLPAACGVLISYLQTCDNPDMDFVRNSVQNLRDLAHQKHNLEINQTGEINVEYLEGVRDQLMEVTGMY